MKHLHIITLAIITTGCSGLMTVLKNQETGDIKTCQVTGSEMVLNPISSRLTQKNCVESLKNAGYNEVLNDRR